MTNNNEHEPPIPAVSFIAWAQHAIFALFGIAFIAWAAAVWNATDLVKRNSVEMEALRVRIDRLQNELDGIRTIADQASGVHARLDQQAASFQQQLDRRLDELHSDIEKLESNRRR